MKKIYSMMLVAAAAMAFVSCQKQENFAPEVSTEEVVLTFASEKPAFDDETKTEWTGTDIQWSAGDKISVAYTVDGNWQNASGDASGDAKLYKSDPLGTAAETAKFNVSTDFKGTTEGAHVFYGVYPAPSSTSFAGAPVATLTVPSTQTPGAASFDGSADLMTGVSVGEFTSIPTETISMKWTRLVAHANITLKALNGVTAGETVSSIKLTAQEGANLVGSQKVNILTNEVTCNNDEANIVDLMGGNLSISAEGNIEFWACFLPTTLTSLKVEVETNKASYTREITGIEKTFKQNARNILSIKMDEATRMAKEEESWVLVTPADGLTEGTYVLVVSTDTKTGSLVSTNGTSAAPTFNTSVSVSGNTLNGVTEAMQFDLSGTAGNYKLAVTGQTTNYLYTTATNNGVRVGTNANNLWTIAQHESNANAFVFKCNETSRYLGVYNNQDWRCYDGFSVTNFTNGKGSSQIYLYKKQSGPVVPDTTPSITVEETLELTSAESEGTIDVTYKNLSELDAAAYSDAECTADCDWLIASWENNAVSYVASTNEGEERTAYIQIYALDADANEYTKVITVTQKAKVDANFEAGQYWIVEPEAKLAMMPLTGNFGYPTANLAKLVDGSYKSFEANIFTIEYLEDDNCYTIKDSNDKYLYMSTNSGGSWYTSYNVSATYVSDTKYQWSISENEGKHIITNIASQYTMAYSSTHSSWGAYEDVSSYALPVLVKAGDPIVAELESITVSGQTTSFTEGDSFEFGGTVTATYTDGSTKDVTSEVSYTTPEMVDGAKVTVSYTEGTVTKSFDYTISVKAEGAEGELVTETFDLRYSATDVKSADWEISQNGVSLSWSKGTSNNTPSPNKEGSVRMYTGTTLTISSPTNTKITRVVFTPTSTSYSATELKYNDVALSSDDWTLSEPVNEIVLTASANARFKEIVVYYN